MYSRCTCLTKDGSRSSVPLGAATDETNQYYIRLVPSLAGLVDEEEKGQAGGIGWLWAQSSVTCHRNAAARSCEFPANSKRGAQRFRQDRHSAKHASARSIPRSVKQTNASFA